MGGCISTGNENYAGAVSSAENNATNRQIHRFNRDAGSRKTLLLLGTGESGKSTFFRQLKLVALKISTAEKNELLKFRRSNLFSRFWSLMLLSSALTPFFRCKTREILPLRRWFHTGPSSFVRFYEKCLF